MSKEKNQFEKLMDTKDSTKNYEKKDIENNKAMAILSYILAPIPYFVDNKSKFVKYHAIQGMNLFILGIAYGIIYGILTSIIRVRIPCGLWYEYCYMTPWWVTLPLSLISLCFMALAILGIVNVCNNKAKELPIINKFKIIKR